jgi:hypothetical protein
VSNYDPQLALRQTIAGVLDHPSVYMGGPSRQHLRKADQIIECLRRDPRLMEALRAGMETGSGYTNEAPVHAPVLPARFNSTSAPEASPVQAVCDRASHLADVPMPRAFSSANPCGPNGECPNCGGLPGDCKPGCQDGSEHF